MDIWCACLLCVCVCVSCASEAGFMRLESVRLWSKREPKRPKAHEWFALFSRWCDEMLCAVRVSTRISNGFNSVLLLVATDCRCGNQNHHRVVTCDEMHATHNLSSFFVCLSLYLRGRPDSTDGRSPPTQDKRRERTPTAHLYQRERRHDVLCIRCIVNPKQQQQQQQ